MDKKRVTAYVDTSTSDLLRETAAALGKSQSSLAAEVITFACPVLEVMRDMALDLATAPDRHREYLAEFASRLAPIEEGQHAEFQRLSQSFGEPPTSNTGVGK